MKEFFEKNKVFLVGLLAAVLVAIQPFGQTDKIQWAAVALAGGIAALSYLAKEWRGQGMSILGIIAIAADILILSYQNGGTELNWEKALFNFILAIGFTVIPDPKSRGYEQTDVIKAAKKEGEEILPAKLTAKPK